MQMFSHARVLKPGQAGHGGAYGTYAAFDPATKTVRVLCVSMSGMNKPRKAFRRAWDAAADAFLGARRP